jgi:CRP-like cAMP-binding protein
MYDRDHMAWTDLPTGDIRRLAQGEALFRAGDPAVGLVLVRSGAVELRRVSAEGRIAVLHRAGPGESFAEASLFEPAHHCDGIATEPSEVVVHPPAMLRRAAEAEPAIGWVLARNLALQLVAERARTQRMALPRAEERILDLLATVPPGPDSVRRPGRSWKVLAGELGLTHEAVYRALARLSRAGTIERVPGGVVLRR